MSDRRALGRPAEAVARVHTHIPKSRARCPMGPVSRLPVGEYIGLAAQTYYGNHGVGTGAATLFDSTGPIGTGTALALAQPPDAFRPEPR